LRDVRGRLERNDQGRGSLLEKRGHSYTNRAPIEPHTESC
jgi:hypothetical protein